MGAKKEILQEGLDAAGKAVTGLPTAVNPSDAVRLDQMQAADAAVVAGIPALSSTPAADIDGTAGITGVGATGARADHKHKVLTGTPVATGTANADGTGTALALATHVHQTSFTGVAAALAAATTDVAFNAHKLTDVADGTAPTDAAVVRQLTRAPQQGEFWVYTLDYDGAGNDTTGIPGIASTMAAALSAATPLKTLERAGQIIPRDGNGATLVVLIKPRSPAGGTTSPGLAYRNMANTADADGSWLNALTGWRFVARGSLDFANDSNDKIRAGFLTLNGTNVAGYSMVSTVRTIAVSAGVDHVTSVPTGDSFPDVPTWSFGSGAFIPEDVDRNLTIVGGANAGSRRILQVLSSSSVITDGTVTSETFGGGVTASVVSTVRSFKCQLVGGGAPGFTAESSGQSPLTGMRMRFKATSTTVALQNFSTGIAKNTTDGIKPMSVLPSLPVAGDDFVIEMPGVTVANLTHVAGVNRTFNLVGFNANSGTTTVEHKTSSDRISGCHFVGFTAANGDAYAQGATYIDEADANITVGIGYRATGFVSYRTTKQLSVSSSSWLSNTTQLNVGTTADTVNIGTGCVCVQGVSAIATNGAPKSIFGNSGSPTFHRLRITKPDLPAAGALFLSGIGANIRGVDIANCQNAGIRFTRPSAFSGEYFIDDIVSPDGGNLTPTPPADIPILQIAGPDLADGATIFLNSQVANSVIAKSDIDILGDGGLKARFKDIRRQCLNIGGVHIYNGAPLLYDWDSGINRGPVVSRECNGHTDLNPGPFPPFRVWRFDGNIIPSGPCQVRLASADSEANCRSIAGVVVHQTNAQGDKCWVTIGGSCKVEFVAGALTNQAIDGQWAYLSELRNADLGKARLGPPPAPYVAVPLGPIASFDYASAPDFDPANPTALNHPLFAEVNLITHARTYVTFEGHAAESVVANPTGAQGTAVDVALGTDQVLGRLGSAHVAGIPISSISGIPVGGHAGFSVLGKATTGAGNDADIAVGTDSVVGRIGSGNVGDIPMTAAGRARGGGASATAQTALLDPVDSTHKGLAPASGGGTANFLRADGTWATPPGTGGGAVTSLTGDVTGTGPGATATTIANDAVTNAKAANMANATIKARITAGTGDPEDATGTQVTALLDLATAGAKGLGPARSGPAGSYLDVTGNYSVPAGTGGGGPLTGLSGDVTTVGGGVAPATIANDAVTFAKMQNLATDTLVGRDTAGTGDPESITVGGGIEFTGSGGIQRSALTGDVSASAGSAGTVINPNVVTNSQLAQVPTGTLKGRTAAGTGNASDLTLAVVKSALAISFSDISGTLLAAQFPALTGDVTTVAGALATTLATTGVTAATYGDGSHVAQFTVDAKGRVTAASSPSISITAGAVSGLSTVQTGALTGDVTKPAGSGTTTLANIPTHTPVAGDVILTRIAPPSAPAAGNLVVYADNADEVLSARGPSGNISHTVKTQTGAAHGFVVEITDSGDAGLGEVDVTDLHPMPALTTAANLTAGSARPTAATVAQMRTMLGLDAPQSLDLFLSFGIANGLNTESQPPKTVVGSWPFWLGPVTKASDILLLGYNLPVSDANLNSPAVSIEFPVDATYSKCFITAFVETWDPQSIGGPSPGIALAISQNRLCDSSPFVTTLTGTGAFGGGLSTCSFVAGDRVGVRAWPNAGWYNNGGGQPGRVKFTVHMRLFV